MCTLQWIAWEHCAGRERAAARSLGFRFENPFTTHPLTHPPEIVIGLPNGTFIDGQPARDAMLQSGPVLRLGSVELRT